MSNLDRKIRKIDEFHEKQLNLQKNCSSNNIDLQPKVNNDLKYQMENNLKTLKTSRKLWQIAASTIPENNNEQDTNANSDYYLSLNSYLTAWIYTIKSLSNGSAAMKQMVDPLNGILCELTNFSMDKSYFDNVTSKAEIIENDYILEMFREMGTTYRMLDMIGKLQKALTEKNNKTPEELTYKAYLNSELSKRHGWVMQNSVKMALKIGLPKFQNDFTLDLAGIDGNFRKIVESSSSGDITLEYVLSKVQQEYIQVVKSMAEVKEYLKPALVGDKDEDITNRIPDIYQNTVFLKNNRNGLLGVCKLEFSDKKRPVSTIPSFNENSKIEESMLLGKECEITICK